MRLYHERVIPRPGQLDGRDEEECFTAAGRRVGVFLTTEELTGPDVLACDVPDGEAEPFEVSPADAAHRSFVVPGAELGRWTFTPTA